MLLVADAPLDWPESAWNPLISRYKVSVVPAGNAPQAVSQLGQAYVLVVFGLRIPNEILDLAPRIRLIVVMGPNPDIVSPDAGRLYRLPVKHLPPKDPADAAAHVRALRLLLDAEGPG